MCVHSFFHPHQMALFLLKNSQFCWVLHATLQFLECWAENMQLLQKYSVNESVTGAFCLLHFCFCSGSDFLFVVNKWICLFITYFLFMTCLWSTLGSSVSIRVEFFSPKDRNPQAKTINVRLKKLYRNTEEDGYSCISVIYD